MWDVIPAVPGDEDLETSSVIGIFGIVRLSNHE